MSNLYGTGIEIWDGFGPVGNTEKKKFGPIMSNFWGRFFHVFMGKKNMMWNQCCMHIILWYDFKKYLVQMFHAFRGRHALIRFQVSWLVSLTTFFFCVGGVQDNAQWYLGYWIFGIRKRSCKRAHYLNEKLCHQCLSLDLETVNR